MAGPRAHAPPRRPLSVRYALAFLLAGGTFLALVELNRDADVSVYSIGVGAVAFAVWYGGVGPGLLCAGIAWGGALALVLGAERPEHLSMDEALLQWGLSLSVALAVVWVQVVLRRARIRAVEAAGVAEQSVQSLETLQTLSSALSAAASVADVVETLVEKAPPVVGAPVALGFVEQGEIVIAQPENVTLAPWQVLTLTEGRMLYRTATEGRPLRALGRDAFEATFPETAALAPNAEAAIAVPLRVEGRVIGSIGFVFDRAEDVHDDAEPLALVVAGLGGQALERARLFEREQESRRGLDRILRVAPRFFSGSESMVTEAICREARTVFGSDMVMLWRVEGDRLQLIAYDPDLEPLRPGLDAALMDFPRLRSAVESLNTSFVADVREEARGEGLERVRMLGIQSSLRVPVVIDGKADLLLVISWRTSVSRPDSSTLVLVQRFADHVGLALEQVERRRAEAEATRRAVEARRLHEMTAALAHAATPAEVGALCLDHARAAVGADGGFVVRAPSAAPTLEIIARVGEDGIAGSDVALDDETVPAARVLATGEPVWAVDGEGDADGPATAGRCIALPLRTGSRVLAAVQLVFRHGPHISPEARDRLDTIVSQCALALERSFLLDSERGLRRRSEHLQAMTTELSNALTRADVAGVLLSYVEEAVGTECAALALLGPAPSLTEILASSGYDDEVAEGWLDASLHASTPQGQALRRLAPVLHHVPEDVGPDAAAAFDPPGTGHRSILFVPLVLGRRPIALLVASASRRIEVGADDLRVVGALAGQAAQALDRARRFETEQTIAETLQRSVLPSSLPEVLGVQLAGRYLPGMEELEVGGDWYDAIQLPSGRLGLVVGDVVGKGVRAAATMGQLRNAIRAFSLDRLKPATTLARLSRLADEVIETSFATVVYAELDPQTGVCRYASAGHPPPLLACLDGRVEYLEGGRGLPLGTGMATSYRQDVVELPDGAVLLFYTDGLIERRGRALDEGLERLRAAAASGPRDPERLVDHVLERLLGDDERRDDVVLLAARLLPIAPRPLDLRVGGDHSGLRHARESLRLWLAGAHVGATAAHDIVLATWEACANAMEHGHPSSALRIRAELDGTTVRVVVENEGAWIPPRVRPERGRGLRLMQTLMSSVSIEPGPGRTRVTLEKHVSRADAPLTTARSAG